MQPTDTKSNIMKECIAMQLKKVERPENGISVPKNAAP
jgi:hypothetical protein